MIAYKLDPRSATAVWYFHGPTNSDADFERYVASIRELESVITPTTAGTGLMLVERENPVPNATWRRRIAEASANVGVGCMYALVCESIAVRGVATAINWLRPPKYEFRAFAALDEAYGWLGGRRAESIAFLQATMAELRAEAGSRPAR